MKIPASIRNAVRNDAGCLEARIQPSQTYPKVKLNGKGTNAHRAAWILAHGPIPNGLLVCHKCDNPKCVNVDHLFLGTQSDNVRDMLRKNRGVAQVGECNRNAKITNEDAKKIFAAKGSQLSIARHYHVSRETVSSIKNLRNWRSIVVAGNQGN